MQAGRHASTSTGMPNYPENDGAVAAAAPKGAPQMEHKRSGSSPLLQLIADPQRARLVKQGAEAKVYKLSSLYVTVPADFVDSPILVKHRFPKSYRHSTLDTQLTRLRISHEAKSLLRCKRAGVDVPAVKDVDLDSGLLLLEWIEGFGSIREVLGGLPEEEEEEHDEADVDDAEDDAADESIADRLRSLNLHEDAIMTSIGRAIGLMHNADVIHGDLTTSNMLLRAASPGASPSVVLIDFGLSYVSTLVEDKAVDLYVLERALSSTHPEAEDTPKQERYIERILAAYAATLGSKEWDKVYRRLRDVRMRGRKRSMVG